MLKSPPIFKELMNLLQFMCIGELVNYLKASVSLNQFTCFLFMPFNRQQVRRSKKRVIPDSSDIRIHYR